MHDACETIANELESMIPQQALAPAGAEQAVLGGFFGDLVTLVMAVRAGDWETAKAAALRILTVLLGPADNPTVITLNKQQALFGGDWKKKLLDLLIRLLPLIAGF